MPTVLRIGPYRFHFYSADGAEPPHVHVARDDKEMKVWLDPPVAARNIGYSGREVRKVISLVVEHQEQLLRSWDEQFGTG